MNSIAERSATDQHLPKQLPISRAIGAISQIIGLAVSQFYLIVVAVTVWEVFARYVLGSPTRWAFEIVIVFCSSAWMLSAGYVTLFRRHISITVIQDLARPRIRGRLDKFGMGVSILALFLFVDDNMMRALSALSAGERSGAGFNSMLPTFLKCALTLGSGLYLAQLLVNLHDSTRARMGRLLIAIIGALIALRLTANVLEHFGLLDSLVVPLQSLIATLTSPMNPQQYIDARSYDLGVVTLVMVGSLLVLMMTGIPLGIVTLVVSIVAALFFFGPNGVYIVSSNAYGLGEQYAMIAIPLFVLMATILERSGVARDLFDAMAIFAGNLRGGVALQTTIVAVVLAAMSGVMGGEIVMLGLVALPQMLRLGYDNRIATGIICAAGSLATLIPPSIVMIIYGLSANVGIGDLFLASFVPGLMLALMYAAYVLIRCRINPALAPTVAELSEQTGSRITLTGSQKAAVFLCILLVIGVMGSIYGGVATVTEAAGVGVLGALVISAVRMQLNWTMLQSALVGTMSNVGRIFWLVIGAVAFVGIYNLIGGTRYMQEMFDALDMPPVALILMMMLVLAVLGTFMEWISITFLTIPVFVPVIRELAPELGLSSSDAALWFGVLFAMNVQVSFLSPPFGPACFWLKSVAPKEVTLQQIFLGVLPFIGLQLVAIALVVLFPAIPLFLTWL
ncbi:TRAP transporter large permease subunit [Sulfitobacter dubius]|uniref:C4-dicarboxylate TRAP transporter large permease protein DctM n=1 Tax=Sulfitobacter dubius TaxID=218673 RepID=A0ABY3ZQN0_9RHOB|nr:TRAP transporter large permease subunit [Sulfitobacter dubius]UOA16941.1 C4-dicarboxylate TRAP transporter large permease protein DctM [Sulfitobacter dubius]